MVRKYCDPTAANGYPAWAATPTWGVPFDGDGIGKTKSTASAVCSIDFSGATAVAGNAINIGGLTLTCVASGAGNAQFNAGSGATLAANIASAINACTSNVPNAVASGWAVNNPLYDILYARVTGSSLEMMTRAGSASYNANANFQFAVSGITGLAGPYQFTGGVSGCWAVFLNPTSGYMKGSRNYFTYGIFSSGTMLAGSLVGGDEVVVRPGVFLATPAVSYPVNSIRDMGTYNNPVIFTIDDGTEYPADIGANARIVVEFRNDVDYRGANIMNMTSDCVMRVHAKRYSDYTSNFVYQLGVNGGYMGLPNSSCYLQNMDFFSSYTSGLGYLILTGGAQNTRASVRGMYYRCRFYHPQNRAFIDTAGNYTRLAADFVECEFNNGGTCYTQGNASRSAAVPNSGALGGTFAGTSMQVEITLDSCKFVNFAPNSQLFGGSVSQGGNFFTRLRNCDYGNITVFKPMIAASPDYSVGQNIFSYTSYGKGDYFRDNTQGYEEWISSRSFPVCNGTLLDGSPWSIRIVPSTQPNNINMMTPFESGRFVKKYTLPDAQRTISCEVAISDQVTWTSKDVSLVVEYQASDGSLVTLSSFDVFAVALTPSATPWYGYSGGSAEVGGKVRYPYDATLHNKFRLSVTTAVGKNIAAGSIISAFVRAHASVANNTVAMFVDPEVAVS